MEQRERGGRRVVWDDAASATLLATLRSDDVAESPLILSRTPGAPIPAQRSPAHGDRSR